MLEIKNLSKAYKKGKKAVDSLNLRVEPGDIYGFIGHNGAGKSTTIKAVVGVLDFEEGEILIDGKNIQTDPVGCKKVMAYIPDNPDLYEHLTGIQYLNFISRCRPKSVRTGYRSIVTSWKSQRTWEIPFPPTHMV